MTSAAVASVEQTGVPVTGIIDTELTKDTWQGSALTHYYGSLTQIESKLPSFERRPFRLVDDAGTVSAVTGLHHAIVRLSVNATRPEVAVGLVSPNYQLVQHTTVVERICAELRACGIEPATLRASVELTTFGERMALSVQFPNDERFRFDAGPGDVMGVNLHCFNSVDGSSRFMMVFGWLRFVCQNGMVIGRKVSHAREAHTSRLDLDVAFADFRKGIQAVTGDCDAYRLWRDTPVAERPLRAWIDGPLNKRWGVHAAARVHDVCMTGYDLIPERFQRGLPSDFPGERGGRVPGSPERAGSVFDVAQALSWVAGRHSEISARFQAVTEVSTLVAGLLKALPARRN